jgi:hypothetical protein
MYYINFNKLYNSKKPIEVNELICDIQSTNFKKEMF